MSLTRHNGEVSQKTKAEVKGKIYRKRKCLVLKENCCGGCVADGYKELCDALPVCNDGIWKEVEK